MSFKISYRWLPKSGLLPINWELLPALKQLYETFFRKGNFKEKVCRTKEIVHLLKALVAIIQEMGFVFSMHMMAHNRICTSSSRRFYDFHGHTHSTCHCSHYSGVPWQDCSICGPVKDTKKNHFGDAFSEQHLFYFLWAITYIMEDFFEYDSLAHYLRFYSALISPGSSLTFPSGYCSSNWSHTAKFLAT